MTDNLYGIKGLSIREYAISANAELGTRDSGKTYAGCKAAEQLYDAGIPSICFDPIGKWHSLRVPGRGKGYPFVVAGGKYADLPLTRQNAGKIVREAMKSGISVVIDLFSKDLSKADWRYIVRECFEILLHENEDHGLRHIFIEEAGEFVPQKIRHGDVFDAVEKVVRMGGNSKLGCTLIHQRPEDINKSVLELCANILLLRQSGRNTIINMDKWLKLVAPDQREKIIDSVPDLKSGEGWLFAHTLKMIEKFKVPERNSKHPDRRSQDAGAEAAPRKAVAADKFVEAMKAALAPSAPKSKTGVATTDRPVTVAKVTVLTGPTQAHLERATAAAFRDGVEAHKGLVRTALEEATPAIVAALKTALERELSIVLRGISSKRVAPNVPRETSSDAAKAALGRPPAGAASTQPSAPPPRAPRAPRASGANGLSGPQAKIMESLNWWVAMGHGAPTRAQTAIKAGMKARGGHFRGRLSELSGMGLVTYPSADQVTMTDAGVAVAPEPNVSQTIVDTVRPLLSGPQTKIFDAMLAGHRSREDIAAAADMDAAGGHFRGRMSELSSFEIVEYPDKQSAKLQDWVTG